MIRYCEFCNYKYDDVKYSECPKCDETQQLMVKLLNDVPNNIGELKAWYVANNLPDEKVTRIFIGRDFLGIKAYGICKDVDQGMYIVYKNKRDGSRYIKYSGKDEKIAVKTLYAKIDRIVYLQRLANNEIKANDFESNRITSSGLWNTKSRWRDSEMDWDTDW